MLEHTERFYKFDIRQWVLVTSFGRELPSKTVRAWFYQDAYLRFASHPYKVYYRDGRAAQNTFCGDEALLSGPGKNAAAASGGSCGVGAGPFGGTSAGFFAAGNAVGGASPTGGGGQAGFSSCGGTTQSRRGSVASVASTTASEGGVSTVAVSDSPTVGFHGSDDVVLGTRMMISSSSSSVSSCARSSPTADATLFPSPAASSPQQPRFTLDSATINRLRTISPSRSNKLHSGPKRHDKAYTIGNAGGGNGNGGSSSNVNRKNSDFDESDRLCHLTNNALVKNTGDIENFDVDSTMWTSDQFDSWLRDGGPRKQWDFLLPSPPSPLGDQQTSGDEEDDRSGGSSCVEVEEAPMTGRCQASIDQKAAAEKDRRERRESAGPGSSGAALNTIDKTSKATHPSAQTFPQNLRWSDIQIQMKRLIRQSLEAVRGDGKNKVGQSLEAVREEQGRTCCENESLEAVRCLVVCESAACDSDHAM